MGGGAPLSIDSFLVASVDISGRSVEPDVNILKEALAGVSPPPTDSSARQGEDQSSTRSET
jgi:hypothetical protein